MTDRPSTRRSFLVLLGLSPVAVPAAAAARSRPPAVGSTAGSAPYPGGTCLMPSDEVDPLWSAADIADYRRSRLITWPDGPEKDQVDREWTEFMRGRLAREISAREAVASSSAPCPFLIDDVGGGP